MLCDRSALLDGADANAPFCALRAKPVLHRGRGPWCTMSPVRRSFGRILSAVALVAMSAACSDGSSSTAPPSSSTTTGEAAAPGDLRHLAERIVALHPDPFHHLAEAEFEARIGDDPADPDELLVSAMRLANLGLGEGHGGVYPWSQDLMAWPFQLWDFPDGLRLLADAGPLPAGARLLQVGGTPIAKVVAALEPLVPHDTEATVRSRLPAYLAFPAVLSGLGLDASVLTWQLPDGSTTTVPPPERVTSEAFRELLGLFQDQVPPSLPHDRDTPMAVEHRGPVALVRWNQVVASDGRGTSLADLVDPLLGEVASGAVTRVVIDARHNPGGDIGRAGALEDAVAAIEDHRPGTVRVLVGRSTFSAASHVIGRMVAEHGVTLVGEPTGGSTRSYADARLVELPASGIRAYVNTSEYVSGSGAWAPLEPDIPVELSWAQWSAGDDPALDAAIG